MLVVLACAAVVLLVGLRRRGREAAAAVTRTGEEIETLRGLVDRLSEQLEQARSEAAPHPAGEYLITTAGEQPDQDPAVRRERVVLPASVGEPLVKAAAFGYGVRKALSPESRSRIAFEMRREVKRARKARRRAARKGRSGGDRRAGAADPQEQEDAA